MQSAQLHSGRNIETHWETEETECRIFHCLSSEILWRKNTDRIQYKHEHAILINAQFASEDINLLAFVIYFVIILYKY